MEVSEKPKVRGIIKEILPPKYIQGPEDTYTISSFSMDVDWSGKKETVVFSAFKAVGDIVSSLNVGDDVTVECCLSSKVFEDKNHRTIVKVSHIKINKQCT
jgi:hypothetical protein